MTAKREKGEEGGEGGGGGGEEEEEACRGGLQIRGRIHVQHNTVVHFYREWVLLGMH